MSGRHPHHPLVDAGAAGDERSLDFPAIVTMDAHGNSLHKDIEQESGRHLETMLSV